MAENESGREREREREREIERKRSERERERSSWGKKRQTNDEKTTKTPNSLLCDPWELLGCSFGVLQWGLLGALWELLGAPWELLGHPWVLLGGS